MLQRILDFILINIFIIPFGIALLLIEYFDSKDESFLEALKTTIDACSYLYSEMWDDIWRC